MRGAQIPDELYERAVAIGRDDASDALGGSALRAPLVACHVYLERRFGLVQIRVYVPVDM